MPGFQNSVDSQDGTSIRLIMQCQYRSICRGEKSIFGRLNAKGIDPREYIEFYALRQWGRIGPTKSLTTEQLYIHAKCMVVDDRAVIIGSANINERSMLGSRDSEVAAVITDQSTVPSMMAGKPYLVGEFAHTLRMRLMREHLGIDVDEYYNHNHDVGISESGPAPNNVPEPAYVANKIQREDFATDPSVPALTEQNLAAGQQAHQSSDPSSETTGAWVSQAEPDPAIRTNSIEPQAQPKTHGEKLDADIAGFGVDNAKRLTDLGLTGGRETFVNAQGHEILLAPPEVREPRRRSSTVNSSSQPVVDTSTSPTPPWSFPRMSTRDLGLTQLSQLPALPVLDDTDIGGPPIMNRAMSESSAGILHPLLQSMRRPVVQDDCMQDPLADSFYAEIWHKVAENNTKLYRQVFRCMPDSEVQTWRDYREFNSYSEKFMQSQGLGQTKPKVPKDAPATSGPPGSAGTESIATVLSSDVGAKAGNRLSGLANKFRRPLSNGSQLNRSPDMSEKQRSASTSHGTAAVEPSPMDGEMDEKAAERQTSGGNHTTTSPDPEKAAAASSPDPEKINAASPDLDKVTSTNTRRSRTITFSNIIHSNHNDPNHAPETTATQSNPADKDVQRQNSQKRRRRTATRSSARISGPPEVILTKDEGEELLKLTQGHLVLWPYDWLVDTLSEFWSWKTLLEVWDRAHGLVFDVYT